MYKLAAIIVFATAFLISANFQGYVQSLRIGIYEYHVFMPVIPLLLALAIFTGNWRKLQLSTVLYILWWVGLCLVVTASLIFVNADTGAVSKASQMVAAGLISVTFVMVAQNPLVAKAGMLGVAAAVFAAAGISLAEFLDPSFNMIIDQRYQTRTLEDGVQRVGGLHVNPNLNACIMALGMFAAAFVIPLRLRLIFCMLVGAAVFTTVSRGGIVTWTLAIVMLAMLGQFSIGRATSWLMGIFIVFGLSLLLVSGTIPKYLENSGIDDLMTENMVDRLSTNFFTQEDGSTSSRKDLIVAAAELYSENPILGAGLTSAAQLGELQLPAHNTILDIAAELGTFGVLTYLSIILVVAHSKSTKAAAFLILFLLQNMFIDSLLIKSALVFILPAGIILLIKLDQTVTVSKRRKHRRKRQGKRSIYRYT